MPDPADVESAVGRWLTLLRDGTDEEQQLARTELGLILESRGLLDDAFEAYARNVEAGVTDRRPYERLAALARVRGDVPTEARALRALADLIAPPPPTSEPPALPAPEPPPAPSPHPNPLPDEKRVALPSPAHGGGAGGGGSLLSEPTIDEESKPRPGRRLRILLTALAPPVLVILIGMAVVQTGPPAPAPPSRTASTIVASSTVVEIRLAAEATVPLPSPTATAQPTSTHVPSLTPTPLPTRCADAELRFPQTRDSEGAVRAAYRDYLARQGVILGAGDAVFTGLAEAYAARHAEVVAGWIGVTLQRERRGLPAFALADYVASDLIVATGPGAYQYRATISPQGWTEIGSWPATTCEGAFIQNPANARWVQLIEASVGDITWALPTAQPAR